MAITFEVSQVERAKTRLGYPTGMAEGTAQRRVLLGKVAEAWGSNPARSLPVRQHGLVQTVRTAFDQHYPLVLTPDAVWLCIAQGFAAHVNANAERLRGKFVRHQGQAEIRIRRDDFVEGSPENPWPEVFQSFSDQIAAHIGRQRDLVVCDFSTTGPCERAASEIVLMEAMHKYFKYVVMTMCGIPTITLEGTVDDYRSIRRRVQALGEYELTWWVDALLPIVDQFIAAAQGRVERSFWQSIYNLESASGGPFVTGWINAFFPYYRPEPDEDLEVNNWFRGGSGLIEGHVPTGISVVPFVWEYFERHIPMELLAGFVGMAQDEGTLALRPAIGWAARKAVQPRPHESYGHVVSLGGERTESFLVVGWVSHLTAVVREDAINLAEALGDLSGQTGLRLDCYMSRSAETDDEQNVRSLAAGRLIVGVELGRVGYPPQLSDPLSDLAELLERLRSVPRSVWQVISSLIPGGLSEEPSMHLLTSVPSDLRVRVMLVYGERTREEQGNHVHSASKWLPWAVRGVKVGEVDSAHARHVTLDMSEAALAARLTAARAAGIEEHTAAHYLMVGAIRPEPDPTKPAT